MTRRGMTNTRCPLCGDYVSAISPAALLKNPDQYDAELVVTKRGLKQYIHSSCWNDMIKNREPYNGKMYV